MSDSSKPEAYGVFKPIGHVIVSFPTAQDAEGATRALADAGFVEADIRAYTPERMAAQAEHDIADAGALASLGQEMNLVKGHLELARQGYSFLVVHAPENEQEQQIAEIVPRFNATRAQAYGRWVVEELVDVGGDQRQVGESPDRGLDAQTRSGEEGAAESR